MCSNYIQLPSGKLINICGIAMVTDISSSSSLCETTYMFVINYITSTSTQHIPLPVTYRAPECDKPKCDVALLNAKSDRQFLIDYLLNEKSNLH